MPRFSRLATKLPIFRSMTSPALEVERKGQHSLYSAMLVVSQALRIEPRQVALDLAAQGVEHIVLAARPGDGLAVPQAQRIGRRLDHRIEHVDHAQRFPRRMTDCDRWRLHRRLVKIERTPGVGRADAGWHRAFEEPREPRKQRQERQGDDEVERRVEVRNGAGEIGLYLDEFNADRRHERQGDRPADETGEEVPTTTRRPAASPPRAPSRSGLRAVPMFAPIINASAALRGTAPFSAKDMTSSDTATLE
jgi:hypothetical protein